MEQILDFFDGDELPIILLIIGVSFFFLVYYRTSRIADKKREEYKRKLEKMCEEEKH